MSPPRDPLGRGDHELPVERHPVGLPVPAVFRVSHRRVEQRRELLRPGRQQQWPGSWFVVVVVVVIIPGSVESLIWMTYIYIYIYIYIFFFVVVV